MLVRGNPRGSGVLISCVSLTRRVAGGVVSRARLARNTKYLTHSRTEGLGIDIALDGPVATAQIVHWTLHNQEVSICCTGRDTSDGVELSLTCRGVPLARRLVPSPTIAEIRALELRQEWEAAGWAERAESLV